MTAPDQSAKIEREAQRQLRGMEKAQSFTEANQAIIGQAMKYAQATEKQLRDQNFKNETEYRRAYREAEAANFQTEIDNDAVAAKAQSQAYKDLSEFSQTAFKLFGTINETVQKAEIGVKHKLALAAGLDLEDLASLRGIESKLDRSQFNQLSFIQQKINEGASSTQINALYEVFKRSGSNQWYEMKSLYQNSVVGHQAAQRAAIEEMFEGDATPSDAQIQARLESFNAKYIETKFAGARPEVLESSGVYSTIRQNTNSLINSFSKQAAKEREEKVKADYTVSLNTKFFSNARDTSVIVAELQANPSADNRKTILGWAKNGVLAGTLTITEAEAILNGEITVGNSDTTINKQFNGFPEVTELAEAIKVRQNRDRQAFRQEMADQEAQVNFQARKMLNDELQETGGVSDEGFDSAREYILTEGGNLSAIEEFKYFSNDAQTSRAVDERWQARFEASGTLPTMEELNNYSQLTAPIRNKWLGFINARKQQTPDIKDGLNTIKNAVLEAPEVKASALGTAGAATTMMVTRMQQEYRRLLKDYPPSQALALTLEKIAKIQADPKSFDSKGNYVKIMQEIQTEAAKARVDTKILHDTIDVIKDQPRNRRDFKRLTTAMGGANVIADLERMSRGEQPSLLFRNTAARLNLPLWQFAETLDKAGNLGLLKEPPIPEWEKLKRQTLESKRGTRLRNVNPTSYRINRANVIDNNSGATAPVRSSFSGGSDESRFRRAIIAKESGGSYTVVNPDSGAIGIGQVMPENVGPWTQKYLGRSMTPEEFRMNPGAQDAVVNGRFKDMLADQRAAGFTGEQMIRRAAAVWYSGRSNLWNDNTPQYYNGTRYPSIAEYTQSIWNKFQSNY